ncbi:MAG: TetR/AcrR family transcriptional regulator [Actinobacteria bacterium]|nr:TetR/AcrR family transcriptional regulator [Actinomycetota bacterium]
MAAIDTDDNESEPEWRQRAVSRSLTAARSRAEQRIQRFLDAAFELIDEKGTTEFTIQEVIDRSKQSLRGFYQYFDGKDELILALFEETVRESIEDYEQALEGVTDPLERLHVFVVRLHEWCDPQERKRGSHNRVPISEFATQLAVAHADRVNATQEPIYRMMLQLVEAAAAAGEIQVDDTRRAASLVMQVVMFSWFGNRIVKNPRLKIDSDHIWQFCLAGLRGPR